MSAAALTLAVTLSWNATALNPGADRPDFFSSTAFMSPRGTEGLLVKSLLEITRGQTQAALETIDQLIKAAPNFKLAHLVRGDLLMARARELNGFGAGTNADNEAIIDFQDEARVRLKHYLSHQRADNIPEYLWQLDTSQKHAIVVDTSQSRLYLYRNENGQPRYIADFYVSVGKNGTVKQKEGDKRTPLGVYFAGARLKRKLPDFYGTAAFPLSYPNEWDRRQGKNGHGIWLHGTPSDTYSRPPRASDGCVVLSNPDINTLIPILQDGKTPVIITREIENIDREKLSELRQDLQAALEDWRRAWEIQDTDNYLAFYSRDFFSEDRDFKRWAEEKRRIQASKSPAEISLSKLSMFRYPDDEREMVVVDFDQKFNNGKLNNSMRKRQYWIREDRQWKILYEGAA
jgi:murein L,D-transpeptidase YafK